MTDPYWNDPRGPGYGPPPGPRHGGGGEYGRPPSGPPYGGGGEYGPDSGAGYGPPQEEEESSLVRMYAVTGGRTAPRTQLAMEALVSSATSGRLGLSFTREYRAISELCRHVRSVAEISALLGIPLGVARVLIADMESEGLVRIYHPQVQESGPGRDLLERVLGGLRRL
ncbi:hypothetical protein Ppa06_33130 [Planomonospora parontospora subsp. parontospora]|uniref:DUF742 domain-containing protein n=2 Tax=Planomonospora parontospora TaxID=58119 RepID=A0AA37BHZ3_9ACTN|nr:DUF742 domain-containing protein [Planomonospora parontospora]GGK75083.1 hypothetical protein GCM10010126_37970 [Planomonospora parontospora]GII09515.1 hypothetical protein Ppa06_33130 [Planomonospora parontospora subsp. parontospora]